MTPESDDVKFCRLFIFSSFSCKYEESGHGQIQEVILLHHDRQFLFVQYWCEDILNTWPSCFRLNTVRLLGAMCVCRSYHFGNQPSSKYTRCYWWKSHANQLASFQISLPVLYKIAIKTRIYNSHYLIFQENLYSKTYWFAKAQLLPHMLSTFILVKIPVWSNIKPRTEPLTWCPKAKMLRLKTH